MGKATNFNMVPIGNHFNRQNPLEFCNTSSDCWLCSNCANAVCDKKFNCNEGSSWEIFAANLFQCTLNENVQIVHPTQSQWQFVQSDDEVHPSIYWNGFVEPFVVRFIAVAVLPFLHNIEEALNFISFSKFDPQVWSTQMKGLPGHALVGLRSLQLLWLSGRH